MFNSLLTATRSCLKKIFVGCVTYAKKFGDLLEKMWNGIKLTLTEGCTWMGTAMRKPLPPGLTRTTEKKSCSIWTSTVAVAKAVAIQRLIAFIGGIICVFVLPSEITNGDLTWFENMLTSSKNLLRDMLYRTSEKLTFSITNLFTKEAGEIT